MGLAKVVSGKSLNEWVGNSKKSSIEQKSLEENSAKKSERDIINSKNLKGITPLIKSIKCNNFAAFNDLIKQGVDVNKSDDDGNSPLHYAAKFGRIEYINILLGKLANKNSLNKENDTPLCTALNNEQYDCAEIFLKNPFSIFGNEKNMLHEAAKKINISPNIFRSILTYCSSCINASDKNNFTPLMCAAAFDNKEFLSSLILNSDINLKDVNCELAVKIAIINNNLECLMKLIKSGINPFIHISQEDIITFGNKDDEGNFININKFLEAGDTVFLFAMKTENTSLARACLDCLSSEEKSKMVNACNGKYQNAFSIALKLLSIKMAGVLQPFYVVAEEEIEVPSINNEKRYNSLLHQGITRGFENQKDIDSFFSNPSQYKLNENQVKIRNQTDKVSKDKISSKNTSNNLLKSTIALG